MSGFHSINELLKRHYDETSEGLVDKAPSRLLRGEGTEKNFYILKIDLVGSTQMLLGRKKGTYLKLAHTFLSSIDKITQDYGADPVQTEYAGDSVLAYFPENGATAEHVMCAASYSRAAVLGIQRLDETLRSLQLKCKVVLHFDALLVSKIGPRANSNITAIGFPLHRVAKLEKEISGDTGRATDKFFQKVAMTNRKYLSPVYVENKIELPTVPLAVNTLQATNNLLSALGIASPANPINNLFSLAQLSSMTQPLPPPSIQYQTERTLIGYDLRWPILFRDLSLNPS